jgi:hypothetical protein
MKQFVLIIMAGFVFSCSTSETEVIGRCYTLIERQCAMDPFNSFYNDVKTPEDRAEAIDRYFEANGVVSAVVKANPVSTDAVCQACICPSGYSYQLVVSEQDTVKLNALDLLLVRRECD